MAVHPEFQTPGGKINRKQEGKGELTPSRPLFSVFSSVTLCIYREPMVWLIPAILWPVAQKGVEFSFCKWWKWDQGCVPGIPARERERDRRSRAPCLSLAIQRLEASVGCLRLVWNKNIKIQRWLHSKIWWLGQEDWASNVRSPQPLSLIAVCWLALPHTRRPNSEADFKRIPLRKCLILFSSQFSKLKKKSFWHWISLFGIQFSAE
jgi:hypothetical protein